MTVTRPLVGYFVTHESVKNCPISEIKSIDASCIWHSTIPIEKTVNLKLENSNTRIHSVHSLSTVYTHQCHSMNTNRQWKKVDKHRLAEQSQWGWEYQNVVSVYYDRTTMTRLLGDVISSDDMFSHFGTNQDHYKLSKV